MRCVLKKNSGAKKVAIKIILMVTFKLIINFL